MNATEVTTYILAGGRGRRFGSDKAVIEIDGQPVIRKILDNLGAPLAANVFISGPKRPNLAGLTEEQFIPDTSADLGPLGGVATCLAHCTTLAALFVACDMPYSGLAARELVAKHDPVQHAASAYRRPESEGIQPLPQILNAAFAGRAAQALAAEDRSLIAFLAAIGARLLPSPRDGARLFHNINRPGDLLGRPLPGS